MGRKIIPILWAILCLGPLGAQEQLGLRTDNYSGVNSLMLNPANGTSSLFKWDVNLAGAGIFVDNNYGYIRNASLIQVLQNTDNVLLATDLDGDYQPQPDDLIADFFDNEKKKYFSAVVNILGPGVMVKLNNGHALGLFTNFRVASSARNIPSSLSYYEFERTPFNQEIDIAPVGAVGMAWSEVGVNYAYSMPSARGTLSFGINLKYLQGYEGFFVRNNQPLQISQLSGDTIDMGPAQISFGFTDSNSTGEDVSVTRNGSGFSFDLGATLTIDGTDGPYQWKFGAALIDIGSVKFNQNVQAHRIQTTDNVLIPSRDYRALDEVDKAVRLFSFHALGDSTASRTGNIMRIWVPGGLSLQADYQVIPKFFVNGTIIQRIPMGSQALKRDNMVAITPRYEGRWIGAMIPVVWSNYNDIRFGTALRLGFLTLGSDNLGSLIGKSDLTGTDFYVALKVNPFDLGLSFGGGKRGKNVRCYEF